jgi:hypothetical protein
MANQKKQFHQLENEAESFSEDDVIAIDGPSNNTRKMTAANLVTITSQNAIAGNLAPAFIKEKSYLKDEVVAYQGKTYRFTDPHSGEWDPNDVEPFTFGKEAATQIIPKDTIDNLFDD